MEQFINNIKDYCDKNELSIEFGWKEKNRRKEITEALGSLAAANETRKLEIVKKTIT